KVAHHASKEAIHAGVVAPSGAPMRSWVATPYNKGKRLPCFEDDEGVHQLQAFERQLLLTALPVGITAQSPMPACIPRPELRQPPTLALRGPRGRLGPPVAAGRPAARPRDCAWAIQFDDHGQEVGRYRGAAAVSIV